MGRRGLSGSLGNRAGRLSCDFARTACWPCPAAAVIAEINRSAGRFPDGADTDSNCTDFALQPATILPAGSAAGATNIKVASVADFASGQTITIDTGAYLETAVIATVGTAGATTVGAATNAGATVIPVANAIGFAAGEPIVIDRGANHDTAVVVSTTGGRGGATIPSPRRSLTRTRKVQRSPALASP